MGLTATADVFEIIYLDMDGTFVNLYGVKNWLAKLRNQDVSPYEKAKPLVSMFQLSRVLQKLQKQGYKIAILSALAGGRVTLQYCEAIEDAKKKWLKRHLPFVNFDYIIFCPYGRNKADYTIAGPGILFDDSAENRKMWRGIAYTEENLLKNLRGLLNGGKKK